MTKAERSVLVSWHIGVSGKQPPYNRRDRKLYNAEWRRQVSRIKRRKSADKQPTPSSEPL